jgi:hypothetical protein
MALFVCVLCRIMARMGTGSNIQLQFATVLCTYGGTITVG